jgi:hypothetical protein
MAWIRLRSRVRSRTSATRWRSSARSCRTAGGAIHASGSRSAGDELLRLGPLVRPLVELHWTRMVAELNKVATVELDLHRHLFGSDRVIPPKPLRDGIAALQDGRHPRRSRRGASGGGWRRGGPSGHRGC